MPTPILGPVVAHAAWPSSAADLAEAAALTRPELRDSLAHNAFISESTWSALYPAKPLPPAKRAADLVSRPLSDDQAAWVASIETRSSVLELVMVTHQLDPAAQDRLASGKALSQTTACYLIDAEWATPAAKEAAARKAGGVALLRWFAHATIAQCPLDSATELIRTWNSWAGPELGASSLVRRLVERRIDLYPLIASREPTHPLFGAMLASRHFSDPALAKLAIGRIKGVGKVATRAVDAAVDTHRGAYADATLRERAQSAKRLLIKYEQLLGKLIANPAVSPEQASKAHKVAMVITRREVGINTAENAYLRRCAATLGTYDPMAGALTDPYEQLSDPLAIAYLVKDLSVGFDGFAHVALAHNPQLGHHAPVVAAQLGYGLSWNVTVPEAKAAVAAFSANYPHLADKVTYRAPRRRGQYSMPLCPQPAYLVGKLTEAGRTCPPWDNPVEVMPERYPLALSLINQLGHNTLCGIAHYVAKRLGTNATAWLTFFALADELAASDLDQLCDTAIALGS